MFNKLALFGVYSIVLVMGTLFAAGWIYESELADLRSQVADADEIIRQQDSMTRSAKRIEDAVVLQMLNALTPHDEVTKWRIRFLESKVRVMEAQQRIDGAVIRMYQAKEERNASGSYDVPLPPLNPPSEQQPTKSVEFKIRNENIPTERKAATEEQDALLKAFSRKLKRIELGIYTLDFLVFYLL